MPGRENSDCENTMKMKIANRKGQFYCAFCWFLRSSFHFHYVLQRFGMPFCSKAAPAALGGCGGLGQLWKALAELWEALGELWEALYIEKLPINRPSGRYVMLGYLIVS